MIRKTHLGSLLLFCAKFIVFVVVAMVVWWELLPYYGFLLVQLCGIPLKYVFGVPIESGHIDSAGLLNTDSRLVWDIGGHSPGFAFAHLVTNVPPYVAIVLATPRLSLSRRLRILAYGLAILIAGHILFIILAMKFQDVIRNASEIPTAIVQFYLTLPFLLWIIFAYWDKVMTLFNDSDAGEETAVVPEQE